MKSEQGLALRGLSNNSTMWLDAEDTDDRSKVIEKYDNALTKYLGNLQRSLQREQVDLREVGSLIDTLSNFRHQKERDYMGALIYPETSKGCKIPSQIPVPSSSFQLHSSNLVTTNSSGHAAICFNPFYLNTAGTNSTFFVNNNAALTGQGSSNFFTSTNILQNIPSVYSRYRVVSASMTVKYIGRLDIVQGVIGGAILYQTNITNTAFAAVEGDLARFGDFNIAQDAFYFQEHMTLNGLRMLYFPIDNSYEQYYDVDTEKPGFLMYAYIYGGVPSSAAYKVDVYVNYECIPDPAFLNYIPVNITRYPGNCEDVKRDAVQRVQSKPITEDSAAARGAGGATGGTSLWDNFIDAVGPIIPKLLDVASSVVPGFKIASSLYNFANSATSK